jgi:hypothetical protein
MRSELVRLIGVSHLLQAPLTWLLASPRGLDLRGALSARSPLAAGVLHNMAVAAVGLPTALGLGLAAYPAEALRTGPAHAFGLLIAGFWCWRLYRQLLPLGRLWPARGPAAPLHYVLLAIFATQGPGLALVLLLD